MDCVVDARGYVQVAAIESESFPERFVTGCIRRPCEFRQAPVRGVQQPGADGVVVLVDSVKESSAGVQAQFSRTVTRRDRVELSERTCGLVYRVDNNIVTSKIRGIQEATVTDTVPSVKFAVYANLSTPVLVSPPTATGVVEIGFVLSPQPTVKSTPNVANMVKIFSFILTTSS